jgi:hypothetical protein
MRRSRRRPAPSSLRSGSGRWDGAPADLLGPRSATERRGPAFEAMRGPGGSDARPKEGRASGHASRVGLCAACAREPPYRAAKALLSPGVASNARASTRAEAASKALGSAALLSSLSHTLPHCSDPRKAGHNYRPKDWSNDWSNDWPNDWYLLQDQDAAPAAVARMAEGPPRMAGSPSHRRLPVMGTGNPADHATLYEAITGNPAELCWAISPPSQGRPAQGRPAHPASHPFRPSCRAAPRGGGAVGGDFRRADAHTQRPAHAHTHSAHANTRAHAPAVGTAARRRGGPGPGPPPEPPAARPPAAPAPPPPASPAPPRRRRRRRRRRRPRGIRRAAGAGGGGRRTAGEWGGVGRRLPAGGQEVTSRRAGGYKKAGRRLQAGGQELTSRRAAGEWEAGQREESRVGLGGR